MYFKGYGNYWHTLHDGTQINLNDITKFVTFKGDVLTNPKYHIRHKIKGGERPEVLSNRLYGTDAYWWTILLLNQIEDYDKQWAVDDETLIKYIIEKYETNNFREIIHHYENSLGYWVDIDGLRYQYGKDLELFTDQEIISMNGLIPVTIYQYEYNKNEKLKELIFISPDKIEDVIKLREGYLNDSKRKQR